MWTVATIAGAFVAGGLIGIAGAVQIVGKDRERLAKRLRMAEASRDYHMMLVRQWENGEMVEQGIVEVGRRIDAMARELGI